MNLFKLFPLLAVVALSGCDAQKLFVAHDTVVGINANISPNRQRGRLVIGYDRDFATVIPKSVPVPGGHDAMASLGCTNLEVDGPVLRKYRDLIVSGEAAIALAKKLPSADFFNCEIPELGGGRQ